MSKIVKKCGVIVIRVNNLEGHRTFFEQIGFEITEVNNEQFLANQFLVVVHRGKEELGEYYQPPFGRGSEIWFSVENVRALYDSVKLKNIKIIQEFGNRGYCEAGDFGVASPEGYLFYFYQLK